MRDLSNLVKLEDIITSEHLVSLDAIVPDDAVISPVSNTIHARSSNLQKERSDLAVGTGVVSTKYPPTIKLELFSTLEC